MGTFSSWSEVLFLQWCMPCIFAIGEGLTLAFLKNLTCAFVCHEQEKASPECVSGKLLDTVFVQILANFTVNLKTVFPSYSLLIHCCAGKLWLSKFLVFCSHPSCPWGIEWHFSALISLKGSSVFSWCISALTIVIGSFSQLCEAAELHIIYGA